MASDDAKKAKARLQASGIVPPPDTSTYEYTSDNPPPEDRNHPPEPPPVVDEAAAERIGKQVGESAAAQPTTSEEDLRAVGALPEGSKSPGKTMASGSEIAHGVASNVTGNLGRDAAIYAAAGPVLGPNIIAALHAQDAASGAEADKAEAAAVKGQAGDSTIGGGEEPTQERPDAPRIVSYGGTAVPGHMEPSSATTQISSSTPDPEALAKYWELQKQATEAAKHGAEGKLYADQLQAKADQIKSQTMGDMNEAEARDQQRQFDRYARHRQSAEDALQGQIDAVQKMAVEPKTFSKMFADANVGTKIRYAIGSILSGIGQQAQARAGNPNAPDAFMQMINQQIDADRAKQESQLANAKWAAGKSQNLLGALREDWGDAQVANTAHHLLIMKAIEQQLTNMQGLARDAQSQANFDQAIALVQQSQADDALRIAEQTKIGAVQAASQRYVPPHVAGGGSQIQDPGLQLFHEARKHGMNDQQAMDYVHQFKGYENWSGASGGAPLTTGERALGYTEPAKTRTPGGTAAREINTALAGAAPTLTMIDEWEQRSLKANEHALGGNFSGPNSEPRKATIAQEALTKELQSQFRNKVLQDKTKEGTKAAEDYFPEVGTGHLPVRDATIHERAKAARERILAQVNGQLQAQGKPPLSEEQLRNYLHAHASRGATSP